MRVLFIGDIVGQEAGAWLTERLPELRRRHRLNLVTPDAIAEAMPPREVWPELALPGTVIVDLHAESMIQKHIVANGLDGQAAAVIGTHTHEPSLWTMVLPRDTG